MNDKLIGLRFSPELPVHEASRMMKALFIRLFESGKVTYSQFLFPYADSLLLSDDGGDCFFGTHALLWNVDEQLLESCFGDVAPELVTLEWSASSITDFLELSENNDKAMLLGTFDELLLGSVRPWSVREQARKFCSFAEHISRMKGCEVLGTAGGYLAVQSDVPQIKEQLAALYEAKTGRIMKEWNRR